MTAGPRPTGSRVGRETVSGEVRLPALTVLRELRGADEGADLEGVFADGAAAQALQALARGRVALLLQLRLRGGQAQVRGHVLQLLRFGLRVG